MSVDEDFMIPQNYGNHLGQGMPTLMAENHQLPVGQYSITEDALPFSDVQSLWYANQLYHDLGIPSAHAANTTSHNPGLWDPSVVQPVTDVLSTPWSTQSSSVVGYTTTSVPFSGHSGTPWSVTPNYPVHPLLLQESGIPHPFLHQSSPLSPHLYTSHVTHSHHAYTEPSAYQSFAATSLDIHSYPAPSGFPGTAPRPPLGFYRAQRQHSAGPSRRRCASRAIEYNGLWIDEEELRKALSEPNGNLIVHQCRWHEGHSPCGLWVTGDKSSINVHIQRWHGGTPGGDKLQTDCRWFSCGQTMLKESISRHIVTKHLEEVWECQGCGKEFVRNDAYGRHAAKSSSAACQTLGAVVSYSAGAREIDARAALESGGRLRYAST